MRRGGNELCVWDPKKKLDETKWDNMQRKPPLREVAPTHTPSPHPAPARPPLTKAATTTWLAEWPPTLPRSSLGVFDCDRRQAAGTGRSAGQRARQVYIGAYVSLFPCANASSDRGSRDPECTVMFELSDFDLLLAALLAGEAYLPRPWLCVSILRS